MKISKAIEDMMMIYLEHGDVEFVTHDLDTGWSFRIEHENITFYKGVCEIYLKSYSEAEEQAYNHLD